MGYCEKHDCVYQTEECPSCTEPDETTSTQQNAERGSRAPGRDSDSTNEKQDEGSTDDHVPEVPTDISVGGKVSGDIVIGDQQKETVDADQVEVDRSTTESKKQVHDESTTVEDSVLSNSNVDQGITVGEEQDSEERAYEADDTEESPPDRQYCPNCGTAVSPTIETCPSCERSFR